ncbi:retrovirus-related Pol polyprotein from transposon 297 [Trichonephila clavipes]|nr:retrovirus-related Pol polyprotein from transposon 297 [Trichonephila clavipes]
MTGWYRKFIPRYADICEPLYQLKKKGAKFNWSEEAQDSFDQIKRTLTETPILQLPNFSEQFNLFTDASGVGIGAVLQQNQKPIAFASRTLNKAEPKSRSGRSKKRRFTGNRYTIRATINENDETSELNSTESASAKKVGIKPYKFGKFLRKIV